MSRWDEYLSFGLNNAAEFVVGTPQKNKRNNSLKLVSNQMTVAKFYNNGSVHRESSLIIVQQDATVFLVRCVLEFRCGWVGVVSVLHLLIYPSSGACDYSVELPHWSHCSWFDVCWSFGVVGLEWYPCCRLLIYPSSGACDYSVELPHWSHCSWFDVCWSFGVVGLEWYPCCRLKHNLVFYTSTSKYIVFYNLKFTLKHLKRSYIFRSYDHPHGA